MSDATKVFRELIDAHDKGELALFADAVVRAREVVNAPAAPAAPAEPAAWRYRYRKNGKWILALREADVACIIATDCPEFEKEPLYAAPPPPRAGAGAMSERTYPCAECRTPAACAVHGCIVEAQQQEAELAMLVDTYRRERDEARAAHAGVVGQLQGAIDDLHRCVLHRDALAAALTDLVALVEQAIVIDTDPVTGEQGYRTKWDSDAAYAVAAGSAALAASAGREA